MRKFPFLATASVLLALLLLSGGIYLFGFVRSPSSLEVMPSQAVFFFAGLFRPLANWVEQTATIFSDIRGIPQLKRDLVLARQALQQREFQIKEKERELELLRQAEGLSAGIRLRMLPAKLIGFVEGPFGGSLILNQGADAGVKSGDAVFSAAGVFIGRIIEPEPRNSKVVLITSPRSRIHVRFQDSRATGVLEGGWGDTPRVREIEKTADIQVGEVVFTSGQDGLALPGFMVGRAKEKRLSDDQFFQEVSLDISFDPRYLEDVFIGLY